MMMKILVGSLLALSAANTVAGNMYIYKDKAGQVLVTNVTSSDNSNKFTEKVKNTYYKNNNNTKVIKKEKYQERQPEKTTFQPNSTLTYSKANISNAYGSSQNIYSTDNGEHRSSNDEISQAINNLSTHAKRLKLEDDSLSERDIYLSLSENSTNISSKNEIQRVKKVVQQPNVTNTSNVAKFYIPLDWSQSKKQTFEYRKGTEEVQVIESDTPNKYYSLMISNGYELLGSSVFQDRKLTNSAFISQARKLGANSVVIYKEGNSTVPYSIYDDPNDLDHTYQYLANFYVKDNSHKQPNMMGISMGEIPLDKRKVYQRNTGAYVVNVIKGSRAYIANIVPEDVVIAVNGKKVLMAEDLNKIKDSELKITRNLNLTIIRLVNNEPREIQVPVSFN